MFQTHKGTIINHFHSDQKASELDSVCEGLRQTADHSFGANSCLATTAGR
jgi:hypothetical protein